MINNKPTNFDDLFKSIGIDLARLKPRNYLDEISKYDIKIPDHIEQKVFAPYPYFGGKRTVAPLVWTFFGAQVDDYIEPFAGGAAMLMGRPDALTVINNRCVETINDKDSFVINAWRAMKYTEPLELAAAVEIINSQQHFDALNRRLIDNYRLLNRLIRSDETYYEPYLAAFWIAGMRNIIGGGFANPKSRHYKQSPRVHISRYPLGSPEAFFDYMTYRLKHVNLMNLTWEEMIGSPTRLQSKGLTAIFIDPPYPNKNRTAVYREDDGAVSDQAAAWAIKQIKNDTKNGFRIVFCGYWSHYHQMFAAEGWTAYRWTGRGYALMGDGQGRENAKEETVWFSPIRKKSKT